MVCLFAFLGVFFPRIALILLWLFTDDVDRAYDSVLIPLLGLVFLPLTTLVYALVWVSGSGVNGLDWLWVAIAFVLDLGSYSGGRYARRSRR